MASNNISFEDLRAILGEEVASIGSPNTTRKFSLDIRGNNIVSIGDNLGFTVNENNIEKLVIIQVNSIEQRNFWHEKPVMKSLLRIQGRIPHISGQTDIIMGQASIVGVFTIENGYIQVTTLARPPYSGTPVFRLRGQLMDLFRDLPGTGQYIGTIGAVISPSTGSSDVFVPFNFRPFSASEEGGWGEGYNFGIFGKSRSGKSIIAANIVALMARNQRMGILIIDPQGEFADNRFGAATGFNYDFLRLLELARGTGSYIVRQLSDVALEGVGLFINFLRISGFLDNLGIYASDKKNFITQRLIVNIESYLERSNNSLQTLSIQDVISNIARLVIGIYRTPPNVTNMYQQNKATLDSIFSKIKVLFTPAGSRQSISSLINTILDQNLIVILDVERGAINLRQQLRGVSISHQELKNLLIEQIITNLQNVIIDRIRRNAQYKANLLVVMDEAHQYVPQHLDKENYGLNQLRKKITDAVRLTGKLGIGWLFITQSTADFYKEIYRQLHNKIFTFGLNVGADAERLINDMGKESFEAYSSLPDPKNSGIYWFAAMGNIVAISTLGKPIFVRSITMNEMIEHNYWPHSSTNSES